MALNFQLKFFSPQSFSSNIPKIFTQGLKEALFKLGVRRQIEKFLQKWQINIFPSRILNIIQLLWYKQSKNLIKFKQNLVYKMSGGEQEFEQFTGVESGSSESVPVQGGSIKKGSYCMLKGFPCKVSDTAVSKPGKHGSAKIHVTGVDIFTGKKMDDIFTTSGTAWSPIVSKIEYEVADVSEDGFVSLIDKNELKEDIKLPTDDEAKQMFTKCWEDNNRTSQVFFTLISACGQARFVSCRVKGNSDE